MFWIPIDYALPENGQYCLVKPVYFSDVFPTEPRHVLRYRDHSWVYYLGDSVHSITGHKITHWMPLPK